MPNFEYQTMKNISIYLPSIIFVLLTFSCKKEPVDNKRFVEKYLIGNWVFGYETSTVIKNTNDTISPTDTTFFTPRDTVTFSNDLQFKWREKLASYEVNDIGTTINFKTNPDSLWQISYLRTEYFKLAFVRKVIVGSDTINYVYERDFSK